MFFSSTGACTATKSPIANHRSSIVARLYFATVTQMFLMPLFVKVESDSSKLLRTVSKSGPNGCKERSKPQKMLMRIKIESFFRTTKSSPDGYTLPQTTTGRAKNDINMNCSHNYKENFLKIFRHMAIKGSGVVPPGEISECPENKSMTRNAPVESWSRQGHFIIRSISPGKHVFCDGLCQHRRRFLEQT